MSPFFSSDKTLFQYAQSAIGGTTMTTMTCT